MAIIKGPLLSPIPIADGGTSATTAAGARAALGITIGGRTILGTSDEIVVVDGSGAIGNPVISIATDPILPGVGAVLVPHGTAGQRPFAPLLGMIRGNDDNNSVEVYENGAWTSLKNIPLMDVQYVAKTGNDANAGDSPNNPKLTIQAAIDVIEANVADFGLVSVLDSGLYDENLVINVASNKDININATNAILQASAGDLITLTDTGSNYTIVLHANILASVAGNISTVNGAASVLIISGIVGIQGNIYNEGTTVINTLALINCTITNTATGLVVGYLLDSAGLVINNLGIVSGFFNDPGLLSNYYGDMNFNGALKINGQPAIPAIIASVDLASNIICADPLLTFGALAAGAHNLLFTATSGATYKIRNMRLNYSLPFAGGDRDVAITDGVTVYSLIPAAQFIAPFTGYWGSSILPLAPTVDVSVPTVISTDLYAVYSGGTTDYTIGSMPLTIEYERVS